MKDRHNEIDGKAYTKSVKKILQESDGKQVTYDETPSTILLEEREEGGSAGNEGRCEHQS